MNVLTIANYVILAVLFSFSMFELSGALLLLKDYKRYNKKVLAYTVPIWEITGTFSIFYLVNFAATYPSIIPKLDSLYIVPIFIAAMLLILRNAILAYSEFIEKKPVQKKYLKSYAGLTLLILFMVTLIIGSSVIQSGSGNIVSMLINPFNIMVFVSVIALGYSCSIILFDINSFRSLAFSISIAIMLLVAALLLYQPYLLMNAIGDFYLILPLLIVSAILAIVYFVRRAYAKFFILPLIFVSTITIQFLEYPFFFDRTINLNSYIITGPEALYVLVVTVLGSIFLAISLSFFVFLVRRSRKRRRYFVS